MNRFVSTSTRQGDDAAVAAPAPMALRACHGSQAAHAGIAHAAPPPEVERPSGLEELVRGEHGDPFAVLGPHRSRGGYLVRALLPGARGVRLLTRSATRVLASMREDRTHPGLFTATLPALEPYLLEITWSDGRLLTEDPYSFGLLLGELDLHLLAEGRHWRLGRCLGAQPCRVDGVTGVRFAVWAPNARRVSVVGPFNGWDARRHPMRLRREAGVWELFVPRLAAGELYKYSLIGADSRQVEKSDPVARAAELPPATASVVAAAEDFTWHDQAWLAQRAARQAPGAPLSVYEVHAASWQQDESGRPLGWRELGDRLIPYVKDLGFTHVELLPVTEHPFGGSWGYQPLSLFAPTARHGSPADFAAFVDRCHQAGIGVILDWVPAHFPDDPHGLARFDGTALYEHADPREGLHRDWNTLIYNFGRSEVRGFLVASALEWLERFHVDGLRVDAVASMLYRDYSRAAGEWVPNAHGGRENLEAVAFLRLLNDSVAERCPGAMTIAEESTAWPGVTAPTAAGGLGFSYKWNMGWMHDTLQYAAREPIHRRWHHGELSFGLCYAYSERFVLPLSHDEVVHGKRSLLGRMPGDRWQRFAGLRAYYGFMWAHPGKKLLFMGGELAQLSEWNHQQALPWDLLLQPEHRGVQRLLRDLNRIYCDLPGMHQGDCEPQGFQWLVGDDHQNSVCAFLRLARDASPVLAVCNFTPAVRHHYRIGVPGGPRAWRELLNSDQQIYGGSGVTTGVGATQSLASHGQACSLLLTLPPLATVYLTPC